jgi:hypothetical protein
MGKNETGKHNQVAQEVKAAVGEYLPPIETPVDCRDEHDNKIGTHEVAHTATFAVKFPLNDAAPGEYYPPPPPPPIHDTAQTSSANPIRICSDEHDEEHDEHALVLIVTDAVEQSNN